MKISYTLIITASLLAITPIAFAAGENKATKAPQESRLKHAALAGLKGLGVLGGTILVGNSALLTYSTYQDSIKKGNFEDFYGVNSMLLPGTIALIPWIYKLGKSTIESAKKAYASSDTETVKA